MGNGQTLCMTGRLKPKDIEALYSVAPDTFVEARTELASELKAAGDNEGAKEVSGLRKPTVAAWAVNRLAREQAGDIEALLKAGRRLAEAQRKTLAGGSGEALQSATRERRALMDRLVGAAEKILQTAGLSSARSNLDKVADTLSALATDEGAADRVRRGVLEKELPPPAGFGEGDLEAALAASAGMVRKTAAGARRKPANGQMKARARAEELSMAAGQAEEEADRLERQAVEAERGATRARSEAEAGRQRAGQARRRAEEALRKLG